jgi:predicted DNA-binding transcriptional regulator AlpA
MLVDHALYWGFSDLVRYNLFESREAIYRALALNAFPPPRKIMGKRLWRRAEVEAWFDAQPPRKRKVIMLAA